MPGVTGSARDCDVPAPRILVAGAARGPREQRRMRNAGYIWRIHTSTGRHLRGVAVGAHAHDELSERARPRGAPRRSYPGTVLVRNCYIIVYGNGTLYKSNTMTIYSNRDIDRESPFWNWLLNSGVLTMARPRSALRRIPTWIQTFLSSFDQDTTFQGITPGFSSAFQP